MKVSVSAIIAVFNPDLFYFEKAVISVLNQTYPVVELIIVNDGGSEDFLNILPNDLRIKVFIKQNEGVAKTRNFAIQQCSGDYIAFLDQDDYWYTEKIQEQLAMIRPGELCMVTSCVSIVDTLGNEIWKKSEKFYKEYLQKSSIDNPFYSLVYGNYIYSSTPLIHHAVFKRVGLFDQLTQPHDDWDFYLRVAIARFPIYFYRKKPLSAWRIHESNESHKLEAMIFSKCKVEQKLLEVIKDETILMVVRANLLIDDMEKANLLYKRQLYVHFRRLVKYNTSIYILDKRNYIWRLNSLNRGLLTRIRKIILKSMRRYIVSFFIQKKLAAVLKSEKSDNANG